MDKEEKEKILQAGKILSQVKKYAREIIKPGEYLNEIANKIEDKIHELGGRVAFPTNLSIDKIAAHYTPSYDDENTARGLLKVDIGVHVDGYIADSAFSLDLEEKGSKESEQNQNLINSANAALESAGSTLAAGVELREIGRVVEKTMKEYDTTPITNLTGHEIEQYDLHAGLAIPNYDNESSEKITLGLYAIEPFATEKNASGKVKEGKLSGIYILTDDKKPRSQTARQVLDFIIEEYYTLPFCSRQIVRVLGTRALIGLRELERNGNLHHFPQLIESSGQKVAQAEHTFLVEEQGEDNSGVTITTG